MSVAYRPCTECPRKPCDCKTVAEDEPAKVCHFLLSAPTRRKMRHWFLASKLATQTMALRQKLGGKIKLQSPRWCVIVLQ